MKRIAVVIFALGLTACAARSKYQPPAGNTAYGSYPFKQIVPQSNPPRVLEGVVVLLPDTVMLTMGGKSCVGSGTRNGNSFAYSCGDVSFSFGKESPLRQNSFRVPTVVWRMQRVCMTYTTSRTTGAEQCSRWGQERVESRQIVSGTLSFLPR